MKRHFESCDTEASKRACDDIESSSIQVNGLIGAGNYGQVISIGMPSGTSRALKLTKKHEDLNDLHSLVDIARDVFGLSKAKLLLGLSYDSDCHDRIGIHMPQLGQRFGNISVPHLSAEQVSALCGPIIHDMLAFDGLHRDIKLANLCFGTPEMRARLVDFSLATNMKRSIDESVITIWYRAPEVILGLEYTEKADVWSMGLVLLNMLSGTHVLRSATEATRDFFLLDIFEHFGWPTSWPGLEAMYKAKFGGHIRARPGSPPLLNLAQMIQSSCSYDPKLTSMAFDLLSMMLKTDHEERATWLTVSKHPFWTIASEAPIINIKIQALKPDAAMDITDFLSKSKTRSYTTDFGDTSSLTSKIILMDHIYHYAHNILNFNTVTVVKAYFIYLNAIHGGSTFGIPLLISSILLAASFNEEIRPNQSFSWDFLITSFDEDPSKISSLVQKTAIEALYNCSGHWPEQMPSTKFTGAMSAFDVISDQVVGAIKAMKPGKLVCL
jgi:serine/threonine protein kinase